MNTLNETLSGFVPMRILSGYGKDKEPYKEKSKDKKEEKRLVARAFTQAG